MTVTRRMQSNFIPLQNGVNKNEPLKTGRSKNTCYQRKSLALYLLDDWSWSVITWPASLDESGIFFSFLCLLINGFFISFRFWIGLFAMIPLFSFRKFSMLCQIFPNVICLAEASSQVFCWLFFVGEFTLSMYTVVIGKQMDLNIQFKLNFSANSIIFFGLASSTLFYLTNLELKLTSSDNYHTFEMFHFFISVTPQDNFFSGQFLIMTSSPQCRCFEICDTRGFPQESLI